MASCHSTESLLRIIGIQLLHCRFGDLVWNCYIKIVGSSSSFLLIIITFITLLYFIFSYALKYPNKELMHYTRISQYQIL